MDPEKPSQADGDEAVKIIHSRLETDPRDFGEPLFQVKHLQMEVRNGAIAPIGIEFGVHWTKPFVILRRVVEMG